MATETPKPEAEANSAKRALLIRCLVLLIAIGGFALYQRPDGQLHLFFPAVPGDAILIQAPNGSFTLIDGGADPAGIAGSLGAHLPFWQHRLANLILSSNDSRHIPGQVAILQRYQIERVLIAPGVANGKGPILQEWQRLLQQQTRTPKSLKTGQKIDLGGATLVVLVAEEQNLLLRIDYQATSVLLAETFDSDSFEPKSEERPVSLLLFPWDRDPEGPFVAAFRPKMIIFSDGWKSKHPPRLSYQQRAIGGATLYHERLDGDLEWRSDGKRVWMSKF